MKQLSRKDCYMIIMLIICSVLLLAYPFFKAQPIYEFDSFSNHFQIAAEKRQMEKKSTSFIRRSYHLQAEAYHNVHVYGHKGAMNVEEIAVFEAVPDYENTVVNACEQRIDALKKSFAGYGITQLEVLEHAQIKRYGNLIVCIIALDADALLRESEAEL